MRHDIARELALETGGKILLVVLDGLGGAPGIGGQTALEAARTPNLDDLARRSVTGLHEPAGPGVTVGSGPGHLALFGYDPLEYRIGRGVLTALGIDFPLREGDVAARGNFATLDADGVVRDRRAGRISTERNEELCARLREISLPDVEVHVRTVAEHRFLFVLRDDDLSEAVTDTDPHATGLPPAKPVAKSEAAARTADLVAAWMERARELLRDEPDATGALLRGFASRPNWPSMRDVFRLRGLAAASYPMYRGVAKLVGMDAADVGDTVNDRVSAIRDRWDEFDFFFLHEKKADSAAEDGDFDRKVDVLERFDERMPEIEALGADVLLVTGDHSTPASLRSHSWHPVPVALAGPHCRPDPVARFGENACIVGALGPRFPTHELIPLALGNALRLARFGA